ncbi:amidase [Granulicella aggregans]|uniref:amidase n=1 Tax=Granulicella aggregans TaxID=474949 RepID=UPI0021E0A689|nr:amidase family protein [Granulicella aggregans]
MPETTPPLAAMSAFLRSGEFDPVTVMVEAQKNADVRPGNGNTYLQRDSSLAIREALALPAKFPDEASRLPLYGIPVSLKDCFDLTGTVTTCGSKFYAAQNPPATANSWIADRLLAAGALITGKTHLHPLAYGITGENPEYGDCLQPRDTTLLTGGSSSGAVASIQEGSALFAIGTDTGGSVRVPAALGGLAGYRASLGLFPEEVCWRGGAHLAPSFDTLGLLFRDLRDAPAFGHTVFGIEPVPAPFAPRIGIPDEAFLHDCDPDVLAAYNAWQHRLRQYGATLATFDTAAWADCKEIFTSIQASEAAAIHRGHFAEFEASIAERLAWGESITPDQLAALHVRLEAFRATIAELFTRFDFLMLPCAPVSRLVVGEDQSGARARILRYTCPISMAGLPTVTLPGEVLATKPDEHFGTGMQLCAPRLKDAQLLALAASL